jgi:hypothetical protein
MRQIVCCLVAGLLSLSSCAQNSTEQNVTQLVESLGGRLQRDPDGQIRSIDLSGTSVTDAQLPSLRGLPVLRSLNLGATEISDAGLITIAGIRSLEELSLWGTPVTNAGLAQLRDLKNLNRVTCDFTEVTASGLRRLQRELPNCRVEWDQWD